MDTARKAQHRCLWLIYRKRCTPNPWLSSSQRYKSGNFSNPACY